MKEKLDLSLDNRQVVSLVIGGLVVLGAVFILGVVVGKKLNTTTGAADAPDLLAALDRKSHALEKERVIPPLTAQDELTRNGLEPLVADGGHLAPPPQLEPPESAKPAVAAAKPPVAGEGGSGPAVGPTKPADSVASERASASLKEAIARVGADGGAPKKGAFTLQLAATPTRAEADRHASKLRARGYAAYVVSADVPGKGTMYRVRMGSFGTREAAQRYLADFKRETQLDAFVTTVL